MVTGKPNQHKVTTISLTSEISNLVQSIDNYFDIGLRLDKEGSPIKLGYSTFYRIKKGKQKNLEIGTLEKIVTYVKDHFDDLSEDEKIIMGNKLKTLFPYIPSLKNWVKGLNLPKMESTPKVEKEVGTTIPEVPSEKVEEPKKNEEAPSVKAVEPKKNVEKKVEKHEKQYVFPTKESALIDMDNMSSDDLLQIILAFKKKRLAEFSTQRVQNSISLYQIWKGLASAGEKVPFERIVKISEPIEEYTPLSEAQNYILKEDHEYLLALAHELKREVLLLKKHTHFEVFISA